MANETNYQRDERIRLEEQRMTRLEDSYTATHELLKQIRADMQGIGKQLTSHTHTDEETFKSIDTRLQSLSTQLNTLTTTLAAAQSLETNVLGLTVKMGSIYTEQGLNKVEVLWRERGDRQVRESVYKQWWAWLSAGLLGGMVLATNGLNLLERIFGG
jgi:hypothetical protein